jgi:hypothetical protein
VNVTAKYKTFCNLTQKSDGKTYVEPYDYELVLEPKKGVIHFGNLFNGNKLLGETHSTCAYCSLSALQYVIPTSDDWGDFSLTL